eukprot:9673403-Ditylum_brightwellii.AAC.1
MFGKAVSLFGQNTLVFEIYPLKLNNSCENFSSVWAYCGLGHPVLDPFRQAIIVCNLNYKTLYIATNLHAGGHCGISAEQAT